MSESPSVEVLSAEVRVLQGTTAAYTQRWHDVATSLLHDLTVTTPLHDRHCQLNDSSCLFDRASSIVGTRELGPPPWRSGLTTTPSSR
jgi:hypothetical protein